MQHGHIKCGKLFKLNALKIGIKINRAEREEYAGFILFDHHIKPNMPTK